MFEHSVIPQLKQRACLSEGAAFLQLRTCGLGESSVEDRVAPIVQKYPEINLAFCVHLGIVDVRLSWADGVTSSDLLERVGAECRTALGDHFVGYGEVSLSQVIFQSLRRQHQTLAVAESCTGGLMGNAFTDIPGVSKVFQGGSYAMPMRLKFYSWAFLKKLLSSTERLAGNARLPWLQGWQKTFLQIMG